MKSIRNLIRILGTTGYYTINAFILSQYPEEMLLSKIIIPFDLMRIVNHGDKS